MRRSRKATAVHAALKERKRRRPWPGPFEQFHHLAETVTGGVIENCGHWVIEEQPGRVLEGLGEFLRYGLSPLRGSVRLPK
jgi:pimeloyl-ACP methyl ester carboxylesterase